MPKALVHIGFHKTGTTAIQTAMMQHRAMLQEHGICYPDPKPHDAHHTLAVLFAQAFRPNQPTGREQLNALLRHYAVEAGDRDVLISSEMFMEHPAAWKNVHVFREFFSDVKVVVYLRRQDLMLESAYNQVVKQSGETRGILESKYYSLNYEAILGALAEVVGRDNMLVRLYQRDRFYRGDVFLDFLDTIGVKSIEERFRPAPVTNESLGIVALEIVRICNRFPIERRPEFVSTVMATCKRLFPDRDVPMVGHYLTVQQRRSILDQWREGNERIRRAYFPEIPAPLFSEAGMEEESSACDVSSDELMRLLVELWNTNCMRNEKRHDP